MADELKESFSGDGGHTTAISCRSVDDRTGERELELVLTVGDNDGSIWISRDFWWALGVKAGWCGEPAITSTEEYQRAFAEVSDLVEANPAEGTPEAKRLEALAKSVEQYEKVHFPIDETAGPVTPR